MAQMLEASKVINQIKDTEKQLNQQRDQFAKGHDQVQGLIKQLNECQAMFTKIGDKDWDKTPKNVQNFVKQEVVVTGNTIVVLQKLVTQASGLLIADRNQASILIAAIEGLIRGINDTFGQSKGSKSAAKAESNDDSGVKATSDDKKKQPSANPKKNK